MTAARPLTPFLVVTFGIALAALLLIALFPLFPGQFNVRVGDIASRTVTSPRDVTFESTSLTEQKQDEAAASVPPVQVFDAAVRDAQLDSYDGVVNQVGRIRTQTTDPARQREELAALGLSERSIDTILDMEDDRWDAVVIEGRRVLTQQLGVSLDDSAVQAARDSIDSRVAPDFSADEAILVAEAVRPLIVTTLVEDAARTAEAREAARAARLTGAGHARAWRRDPGIEPGDRRADDREAARRQARLAARRVAERRRRRPPRDRLRRGRRRLPVRDAADAASTPSGT